MTVYLHELKRGRSTTLIWSAVIAFLLAVSILIFPMMLDSIDELNQALQSMGDFASAFGIGKLGISDFIGYYSLECGEMLGIGGAIFAALCGISILSREENEHTAEFLLTHPISRTRIAGEKLLSVLTHITALNMICSVVTFFCILIIGQHPSFRIMALIMLSYYLLHIEIAAISFGISAFLKGRGTGIGIGIALLFYFMSMLSNITDNMRFMQWLTPFSYANGSWIAEHQTLDFRFIAIGAAVSAAAIIAGFIKYNKKDIAA